MRNPVFSIIICTYNRNELLKEVLQSFIQQSFHDYELIVVDRGSVPCAKNIVEEFKDERFSFVQSSQEEHFCDVVNKIAENTKGKYLCVFGDDDLIYKETLDLVNLAFDKYNDCDIVIPGSISLMNNGYKNDILIPSHFSLNKKYPYFREVTHTKFIGKEYLRWIMSNQLIGPEIECNYPCYIHPSVYFLRKGKNYDLTVKAQGGIAVKPSFDSGFLGLVHKTNICYINAPCIVIRYCNDNVSTKNRRFWNKETEDILYMPKIANLLNRGADSILRVLHLNRIENEFDIRIREVLWRSILDDIVKNDTIIDEQTFKDMKKLFPYYINGKHKIKKIIKFISYYVKLLKKSKKSLKRENEICEDLKSKNYYLNGNSILKFLEVSYSDWFKSVKIFNSKI